MRRILISCAASLIFYAIAFGSILDRPLSLGFPQAQLDAKLARGAAIDGRKLVILAGSNGPYSHRCETIEPILGIPCVNAGVAVGIGLDYLFTRWKSLLHPGDIVYLPLEEAQYTRGRLASRLGPDAAIMARHDHATLLALPPARWIAALFAFDLRAGVLSLIETALVANSFHDPRANAIGTTNAWGDHVGHTLALALASRAVLAATTPIHATADNVQTQEGGRQVAEFLDWARIKRVRAIGGLPTGFDDAPMPEATVAAIRTLFEAHGARFLELPNRGRYPRLDFFDTADHLNEPAQIAHSILIGSSMRAILMEISELPSIGVAARTPPP